MRIGVVSTAAIETPPSGNYGGIEVLAWELVRELAELGHSVTLYGKQGSRAPAGGRVVFGDSEGSLCMKAVQDAGELDIVHDWSHSKATSTFNVTNVVSTCFHTDQRGLNPLYPTHAVAKAFGEPNGPVIYPGIDLSPYRFSHEREEYLLYFGRIASYKGVDVALEIAEKLKLRLLIAGHDGFFAEPQYAEMIKKRCLGPIIYMGERSLEDKVELLCHAKALIMPSRWMESFGIIAVEALASGCPVICPSNSGTAEIIEEGVTGYACSSFHGMEEAVRKIFSHPPDPEACRSRAQYFSARRMAEDFVAVYPRFARP